MFSPAFGENEKSYTVEGLSHYITDISELPKDMFDKMDKQLQEDLTAKFAKWETRASSWNENNYEKMVGMEFVGNYWLSLKDGMDGNPHNYIYFIYKVSAANDKDPDGFEYYWYGEYKDILVLEDGTCSVDLGSYKTPEDGSDIIRFEEHDGYYKYYGFKDLDSAFNKLVVTQSDKYDYKESIGE